MARRSKSLHHNLGDKNIIFHSEHRSKKGRTKAAMWRKEGKIMRAQKHAKWAKKREDWWGIT